MGCDVIAPSFTYRNHKKAVHFAGFVEANLNMITCDGSVHVWDPYTGKQVPMRKLFANFTDSKKFSMMSYW